MSMLKNLITNLLQPAFLVVLSLSLVAMPGYSRVNVDLPELGNTGTGLISKEREYDLGQAWLRSFRSQVRTISDPVLSEYLEDLIFRLATHSELKDRRLELVMVHNRSLNAFAVPGGVIGIHDGLFLHAETESELAAVLGHELAHLSQNHFARGVEKAKRNAIPNMLALLGSLVIAATAGADAGIAAITTVQAASLQSRLNFSRHNELEADRLGMKTLVNAGIDPNAVPDMFERMQRASRYYRRPPEFLLTHPVSETRIADAKNRARDYPVQVYSENDEYHLMRARIQASFAENPGEAIKRFKADIKNDAPHQDAARYGLVLAYIAANKLNSARAAIKPLINKEPHRITYQVAMADIEMKAGRYEAAESLLESQLAINPDNHPLTMQYAEVLLKQSRAKETELLLLDHVELHPHDEHVWYLLAETHGLAGNISGVHQARAEYFILNGVFDQAQKQLRYALKLEQGDYLATAKIRERLNTIEKMKKTIKI